MSLLETLPKPEKSGFVIDYAGVLRILPHRYPFLFIDGILEYEPGLSPARILALKNVTFNEPYFLGHFPSEPVMPGVIQVEAMAQAACILMYLAHEDDTAGKRPAFMSVDACKFRRPVRPGDRLHIEAVELEYRRGIGTLQAKVMCGSDVVSEAVLKARMV